MRFQSCSFGSIRIDDVTYENDVVIDRGDIRKRKKKSSQRYRADFGHTPLSIEEDIPWKCRTLVIGTGMHGALPVTDEVKEEAKRRNVELVILKMPTAATSIRSEEALYCSDSIWDKARAFSTAAA